MLHFALGNDELLAKIQLRRTDRSDFVQKICCVQRIGIPVAVGMNPFLTCCELKLRAACHTGLQFQRWVYSFPSASADRSGFHPGPGVPDGARVVHMEMISLFS